MSYLVLARKWRPRNFAEMAGQQHVLRALVNALESGRVHHAFLFTGTRGVGKTTISRILAKSLNCEKGVTSQPCGTCSACTEIDAGRFVDLIEVDAASRTKVDDTRELLDNVQYSPARGRYKVFLIDEVHMLSTHSFNALLKTLEEPPPHVKFMLATTDPQKLPITVLSRCLQFNLKRLPTQLILKRVTEIAIAEKFDFEPEALRLVANAAQGSMRDALSLLDQVVAFGGNRLSEADTRTMLGTVERTHVFTLLKALAARDAKQVLACIAELDERVPDYHAVLGDIASTLQRIALLQVVPDLELDDDDIETLRTLSQQLSPEDSQLYYQFAIVGRRDLDLAPEPRGGFEMTLLRMLAFRPLGEANATHAGTNQATPTATLRSSTTAAPVITNNGTTAKQAAPSNDWQQIVAQLNLQGAVTQLAAHCTLQGKEGTTLRLLLDANGEPFRRPALEDKLTQALSAYYNETIKLEINVSAAQIDTPARRKQVESDDRLKAARTAIDTDPNIQAMRDMFGATVLPDSIKPN